MTEIRRAAAVRDRTLVRSPTQHSLGQGTRGRITASSGTGAPRRESFTHPLTLTRSPVHSDDITAILRSWPHHPGRINVRFVKADDGRTLLQIRLDLGLLQLETSGRPDGLRPRPARGPGADDSGAAGEGASAAPAPATVGGGRKGASEAAPADGYESLLHLHQARREIWKRLHGDDRGFVLTAEECAALREEAVQYYHRYVGLLVLEEYQGVVRDTTRNLDAFNLCRAHAAEESDRTVLEQFRPYVIMMRTRAQAAQEVNAGRTKAAVAALDRGLLEIREALDDLGTGDRFEGSNEVQLLRGMREMLVPRLPVSQRSELQERLRAAIAAENYELAAILRDELRMLEEGGRRKQEGDRKRGRAAGEEGETE
jgi:hypothetical protein